MRLDQAVAARFPDISRRKARELIAARRVLVNERVVAVASRWIEEGDRVAVVTDNSPLDIIASTSEWIAANKPAGMPTQPPRDRAVRSLEELLRIEHGEIYLVHRIDTPTSGVVLFARSRQAAADLSSLFATNAIRKSYLALIDGTIRESTTIDEPIAGRSAVTDIRPLRDNLVEVQIQTGRTHQIRIHLASIGHPIAGDRRYGGSPAPRMMLHAWKLEHESIGSLTAAPPGEFLPL